MQSSKLNKIFFGGKAL